MNASHSPEDSPAGGNAEELRSVLFAQMVMQQSSMAMMLLGKTAHPETGQPVRDLEAAKLFIDQLEMLEFKTKGNLSGEEAALLKQSLMSLRMAFVEAVDSTPSSTASPTAPQAAPTPEPAKEAQTSGTTPTVEERHAKFTKKY